MVTACRDISSEPLVSGLLALSRLGIEPKDGGKQVPDLSAPPVLWGPRGACASVWGCDRGERGRVCHVLGASGAGWPCRPCCVQTAVVFRGTHTSGSPAALPQPWAACP